MGHDVGASEFAQLQPHPPPFAVHTASLLGWLSLPGVFLSRWSMLVGISKGLSLPIHIFPYPQPFPPTMISHLFLAHHFCDTEVYCHLASLDHAAAFQYLGSWSQKNTSLGGTEEEKKYAHDLTILSVCLRWFSCG